MGLSSNQHYASQRFAKLLNEHYGHFEEQQFYYLGLENDSMLIKTVFTVIGGEGLFGGKPLLIRGVFYNEDGFKEPARYETRLWKTRFKNVSSEELADFSESIKPYLESSNTSISLNEDNEICVAIEKDYGILGDDGSDESLDYLADQSVLMIVSMLSKDSNLIFNKAVTRFGLEQQ